MDKATVIGALRNDKRLQEQDRTDLIKWTHAAWRDHEAVDRMSRILANACLTDAKLHDVHVDSEWAVELPSEIAWWFWKIGDVCETGFVNRWFSSRNDPFPYAHLTQEGDVSMLDVGCGPRSMIGLSDERRRVSLTSVDPLARAYNAIYKLYGVDAPELRFGVAEALTSLPNIKTYDIVWAKNCLDHAFDVPHAFREVCAVVAPGGSAILEHWRNEAEAQKYEGLHRWNIDVEGSDVVIWNPSVRELFDYKAAGFDMTCQKSIQKKGTGREHEWISITLTRKT